MRKTVPEKMNFLMLYDLDVRDRELIEEIATELKKSGYSVQVEQLACEESVMKSTNFDVVVINKPHFFYSWRIRAKLRGIKYVVLDTEGVLPGRNRQHCLLEPEGYLHWYSHQAERYKFKKAQTTVIGYPRRHHIVEQKHVESCVITVATNFSALGYSRTELRNKKRGRRLKLKDDWDLFEYREYQENCFSLLIEVIKRNPNWKFIVKPHPNDAVSTWRNFRNQNLKNIEIFDHSLPIGKLFAEKPAYHLCFDGCTTILDAHLAGLKVVTLLRFKPLDSSLLRTLEIENISCPNFNFDSIEPYPKPKTSISNKKFIEETKYPAVDITVKFLIEVLYSNSIFRLYDFPTLTHIRYWFSLFRHKAASIDRAKIAKE